MRDYKMNRTAKLAIALSLGAMFTLSHSASAKGTKVKNMRRLAAAKSPYLLQHADNPVDWYEWSDEAFDRALKENKLVFLSIGYSTCHWCHVMAHESFEDDDVAAVMNSSYVSIKVDREERPDIDGVYMAVCQMMTGRGGWPLTVIMTPEKKPLFVGTYIPKESRFGRIGLVELLKRIAKKWQSDGAELIQSADLITKTLAQTEAQGESGEEPGRQELDTAFHQLRERFDERHGGFGIAPKFPTPHNLYFLMRYWKRTGEEDALRMVEQTLDVFAQGGMWDHLGYGFHRYSTDRMWLLPHFEKMLYDQALISMAYIEAYQATGKVQYRRMAEKVFEYVGRLLTSKEGVFYSAEDADSEGEEGKFYLWTKREMKKQLGGEADFFNEAYNIKSSGNYVDEATHEKTGKNILHRLGKEPIVDQNDLERLEEARKKLFFARLNRVRPGLDDKVLTDWNGLMIAALARGAFVFKEPKYAEMAQKAASFILREMRSKEGRLYHRYRNGHAGLTANLDDHAYLSWGLMELYESTFDTQYIEAALKLVDQIIEHFWDEGSGGFFFTPNDGEELIFKRKETYDGARPSGNSVAYLVLLKASRFSGISKYEGYASELAKALGQSVKRMPSVHTFFLCATDFAIGPVNDVLLVGEKGSFDTEQMLAVLRKHFVPSKVVLFRPAGEKNEKLPDYVNSAEQIDGKTTAFLCQGNSCGLPETDCKKLAEKLTNTGK